MTTIWEDVKDKIKDELPQQSFSLWIDPLTYLEKRDDKLILGCPNKFSLNWISENYREIIEEELDKRKDGIQKLSLKINPAKKKDPLPSILNDQKQLILPHVSRRQGGYRNTLNHDFTFDRFVVGKCNEFAYSVSRALAQGGELNYSHLLMLAKTGLGKSHLSQAIGHAILDNNPKIRVLYITAENFINQMILALKTKRIDDFKNKFRRSCDVLLLEEVHFLSGKEKTQTELEHTLDALINDNKKIIFTSSLPPKNIPNLKKGLASRLTSGIITTLNSPDYQTRSKIIEIKASEQNLTLHKSVVELLANSLRGDVRQMESAIRCLKAKSDLLKEKITPDLTREVLKSHVSENVTTTMEDVKSLVCKYFKIDPVMLGSKSRKKIHAFPRNIYVYLCRHFTDSTVQEIGKTINRNHSTVLYASEVIEHKINIDNKVKIQVEFLKEKLKEPPK